MTVVRSKGQRQGGVLSGDEGVAEACSFLHVDPYVDVLPVMDGRRIAEGHDPHAWLAGTDAPMLLHSASVPQADELGVAAGIPCLRLEIRSGLHVCHRRG